MFHLDSFNEWWAAGRDVQINAPQRAPRRKVYGGLNYKDVCKRHGKFDGGDLEKLGQFWGI